MNNDKKTPSTNLEQKKAIQKRVIMLERYNLNQKEFTNQEMVSKIKKIIESEVAKSDN